MDGLSREAKQRIVDQLSGSSSNKQAKRIQAHASTQLPSSHDDTTDNDANAIGRDDPDPQSDDTNAILTNVANTHPIAHPGDPRRVLSKQATSKSKPSSTRNVSHVGFARSVYDSDSDSDDDVDPFDFASLPAPPHSQPIFEDSRAGRAAWRCEYNDIDRSPQPLPSDSAMRSAYQTLSTVASDYGPTGDDYSSDDDDAWYHTDPEYYDNLDF